MTGSRPDTRPSRRRKGTEASRDISSGPISADTRAATPAKLPGILVIHENRGLNPHIEDIARRLALANFMAFAPDALTSVGGFPGDDYKGGQLFSKVDGPKDDRRFRGLRDVAEDRAPTAPARSASPVSATAAASPIRSPSGWGPIWRPRRRSTAALPPPRTFRRSRRRFWSITASSTRDWQRRGRRTTRP